MVTLTKVSVSICSSVNILSKLVRLSFVNNCVIDGNSFSSELVDVSFNDGGEDDGWLHMEKQNKD